MRLSKLFTKTNKNLLKDESSISGQLLTRAGYIDKLSAGIYTFLPLGWRVIRKIKNIIRQEMEKIDGQEIFMPVLHPKKSWEITKRWEIKEMFKLKNKFNQEYGLGWTHEEIITPLVKKFVSSYKDLPVYVFQIQTKMRDETRAKSGVLRTKEFIMKDLYSFHSSNEGLDNYYEKVKNAYFQIFNQCGIGEKTFLTLASGGTFSKYSHEFQTLTKNGEDIIYICQKCGLAINKEIKNEHLSCPECGNKKFKEEKSIEVGNIFKLGTKYSQPFNFKFTDKDGSKKLVIMGCYGIGIPRLMGAIIENNFDEKGIIWPELVAPYQIYLISLETKKDNQTRKISEEIYQNLKKKGIEVLYDDRKEKTAGEKFTDADLIGIPWRMVISEKTIKRKSVEIKRRNKKNISLIPIQDIEKFFIEKF